MLKICTKCGLGQVITEFTKHIKFKDGHRTICKSCEKLYRMANKEHNSNWHREYYRNNKDRLLAKRKLYHKTYFRMKYYGISNEQYEEMLKSQNGLCAICGKSETALTVSGEIKPLSIDHNHDTGIIRKLLCARCNIGLGAFDDNINILLAAVEYLKDAQKE